MPIHKWSKFNGDIIPSQTKGWHACRIFTCPVVLLHQLPYCWEHQQELGETHWKQK